MKVNFNTNHSNVSANKSNQNPSFGKFVAEKKAMEVVKKQYLEMANPYDLAKMNAFAETFKKCVKSLSESPLVAHLKVTKPKNVLVMEVKDTVETPYFASFAPYTTSQSRAGNLEFLERAEHFARKTVLEHEELAKLIDGCDIELVDTIDAQPKVSVETRKLAETLQAKGKIDEEETITILGKPATDPLDWPC